MADCDRCGDAGVQLFRHRVRTETMTHRRTVHVCSRCHPSVSATAETTRSPERVVTDGGRRTVGCPTCSGTTIDDGDGVTCVDCGWSG